MKLKNKLASAAGSVAAAFGSVAHAELPAAATAAFTQVQTDGLALIDLAWPVAAAITGGFILLGLFKKGAKKAAS